MENNTKNGAGRTPQEIVSEYMRSLQKKSALKRKENDPNTYKKMRAMREEKKEDLTIKLLGEND